MIKLKFTDPDIEHSPTVIAWLRECERILNQHVQEAEQQRMRDELFFFGVTRIKRD